jgi:hypothetical protein
MPSERPASSGTAGGRLRRPGRVGTQVAAAARRRRCTRDGRHDRASEPGARDLDHWGGAVGGAAGARDHVRTTGYAIHAMHPRLGRSPPSWPPSSPPPPPARASRASHCGHLWPSARLADPAHAPIVARTASARGSSSGEPRERGNIPLSKELAAGVTRTRRERGCGAAETGVGGPSLIASRSQNVRAT